MGPNPEQEQIDAEVAVSLAAMAADDTELHRRQGEQQRRQHGQDARQDRLDRRQATGDTRADDLDHRELHLRQAQAQQQEHLNKAMLARDVIGQAKGILMERHKLTADQAFAVLTRASQDTNTKLIEVARALSHTGRLIRSDHR